MVYVGKNGVEKNIFRPNNSFRYTDVSRSEDKLILLTQSRLWSFVLTQDNIVTSTGIPYCA